ncbi:transposable element Tcb1 transposase [Trichonephila clavipes]|nr:transposable element Tcb1 transposase [Trichonephila clavipes]
MPPKRSAIGRSTKQAKRRREERASETSEQRKTRQERDRVHTALWGTCNLNVSDWDNVMLTDESIFALEPDDKCIRMWRERGTRNQPQNITEHHAFQGRSIMADISLGDRTDLHIFKRGSVTAIRYRDEVLESIVRLCAAAVGPTFVLMDNNARPHRADIVDDYLERRDCAYLHVSHLQPLLLNWKLLYKKNGDCLILRWFTI